MVISANSVTENEEENEEDDKQTSITDLVEHDDLITMTAAGTFTSTGYLGNSSNYFDYPQISFDKEENDTDDENNLEQASVICTIPIRKYDSWGIYIDARN